MTAESLRRLREAGRASPACGGALGVPPGMRGTTKKCGADWTIALSVLIEECVEVFNMHTEISEALDLRLDVGVTGDGDLPSCFAVTSLLTASVAAVGSAASTLIQALGLTVNRPTVTVDRRFASLWAARSIYPIGWELPPVWDSLAGDYRTRDGWIKLHTNLPHHRRVVLDVLACSPARDAVARAVRQWDGDTLRKAVRASRTERARRVRDTCNAS
jgi:hypothetical protein